MLPEAQKRIIGSQPRIGMTYRFGKFDVDIFRLYIPIKLCILIVFLFSVNTRAESDDSDQNIKLKHNWRVPTTSPLIGACAAHARSATASHLPPLCTSCSGGDAFSRSRFQCSCASYQLWAISGCRAPISEATTDNNSCYSCARSRLFIWKQRNWFEWKCGSPFVDVFRDARERKRGATYDVVATVHCDDVPHWRLRRTWRGGCRWVRLPSKLRHR